MKSDTTTMNKVFLLAIYTILTTSICGQTKFEPYENGLIYSEETIENLGAIVDSLNLAFAEMSTQKTFYSNYQTIGHSISLKSGEMEQAKRDLDDGISFESFLQKYPQAKVEFNALIGKARYQNHFNVDIVEFAEIKLNGEIGFHYQQTTNDHEYLNNKFKGKWLVDFIENKSLKAFFFLEEFKSIPLNPKYGRIVNYADYMVGTSIPIPENQVGNVYLPDNWKELSNTELNELLHKICSIELGKSCGLDFSPQIQAVNIALLSAKTNNWDIFLKAHLNILTERFGGISLEDRDTYIKELEALNINVVDLFIGIYLSMETASINHYRGSLFQLAMAISESDNKNLFENQLLSLIEDNSLDDVNRVYMYLLFVEYNNRLDDEARQRENELKLKKSTQKMPSYLSSKIGKE